MNSTELVADIVLVHEGKSTAFLLPDRESDHIQRYIYTRREFYELDLLSCCAIVLSPDDLVVDAGGCIGNHTLFFANVCGARVVAFEPNPAAFRLLEKNVALNRLEGRVTLRQSALGREETRARLSEGLPDNAGSTRLVLASDGPVPVVPLDGVQLPSPPRLIKIDVEGMEADVLRGAQATIRTHRPLLCIEARTKADLTRMLTMLAEWEYVAIAQFNASPTILFAPGAGMAPALNAQLAMAVHSLLHEMGRHGKRQARSIGALSEKQGEQFESLRKDLSDATRAQAEILEALGRIEARIIALEDEPSEAAGSDRLRRKLRKLRRDPRAFFADMISARRRSK